MALELKSESQIQSQMLALLISELGLTDINAGSVIDVLTQAAAQEDFALYYQLLQVSKLTDINNLRGDDLDTKGLEFGLTRIEAQKATGFIRIEREAGFVKYETQVFAGSTLPQIGDTTLNVLDASNFTPSGSVVIGRGTSNEEEVSYNSITTNGSVYTLNLDNGLVNAHASTEKVILVQGSDVVLNAGTLVRVPSTGTSPEILFELVQDVTLFSGEDLVDNVLVIARETGSASNIPIGAINGTDSFVNPPFAGARAYNFAKFTNGSDEESDDDFRDRIKTAGDDLTRGVQSAILNAIIGLTDPETGDRVVSANLELPVDECGTVKVFIDNGLGFVPTFKCVGNEELRRSANAGEKRFQLANFPVTRPTVVSTVDTPVSLVSADDLFLRVDNSNIEQFQFLTSDFVDPTLVTAQEVITAINDRSALVEASIFEDTRISLQPKDQAANSIQVIGGGANNRLQFPSSVVETLNLYVDGDKLEFGGATSFRDSIATFPLSLAPNGNFNMQVQVDGKTTRQIATLNTTNGTDVVDASAITVEEIVAVIQRDMVGVNASIIDGKIRIESAKGASSEASILTEPAPFPDFGSAVFGIGGGALGSGQGYKLNKSLGLIELVTPLEVGQSLTVGTDNTRATLRSSIADNYVIGSGESIDIQINGLSEVSINFGGTFASGGTAQQVVDFINNTITLSGVINTRNVFARVKVLNGESFIELVCKSYLSSTASNNDNIRVANTQGAIDLGFDVTAIEFAQDPNTAFLISERVITDPEQYFFRPFDTLVVVADQDIVNKTYNIPFYIASTATAGSQTSLTDLTINDKITETGLLNGYDVIAMSGANSVNGVIQQIIGVSGATKDIVVDSFPTNLMVGDILRIENLDAQRANGYYVIEAITGSQIRVTIENGLNGGGLSGTATFLQKRSVTGYNQVNGLLTFGAFDAPLVSGDEYQLIPRSTSSIVEFMHDQKVTSVTNDIDVALVNNTNAIQLSSKISGVEGAVEVTGGNANRSLEFDTELSVGSVGYCYNDGLVDLVHRTIYGDDSDLISFPGFGAAGVNFEILSALVNSLTMSVVITLSEGFSVAQFESEIKSIVTGHINALGVGEDVILEQIRAKIVVLNGIIDVVITNPTENIEIASNEVPRITADNVTIG